MAFTARDDSIGALRGAKEQPRLQRGDLMTRSTPPRRRAAFGFIRNTDPNCVFDLLIAITAIATCVYPNRYFRSVPLAGKPRDNQGLAAREAAPT